MSEPRPPDDIPVPEAPKKGFNVEVRQPEMLFKIARNIVNGTQESFNEISSTQINDSVFTKESTVLRGFKIGWGREKLGFESGVEGTFHYATDLHLSRQLTDSENHGYFSADKAEKIEQILVEKGIRAVYDNNFFDGQGAIKIERDGFFFELFLGYPDRRSNEDAIKREVAEEEAGGEEDGYAKTYELPEIAEGLVNNSISLDMINRERYETGREGYPILEDEASFIRATNIYVDIYKQAVTAVYEAEGKTAPDKTVIFRPSIKSEDAFTKIASTSRELPISVTAEQLQTEAIGFEDIAGQDGAVAEAKRLVLAINHPEIFEKRGVKRPKGILFYGPPGTGKTLIAKAVAREANAEFLQVSVADIGTKWYGESERLMQEVFNIANKDVAHGKKVVLFFDEIDSLAPSREDSHEATRKVVATLLQNMDGMKANPNVTILAATNRPQDIDPALKRPGRFDKLIPVVLPNAEGRAAILKVHMERAKGNSTDPNNMFSPDIDLAGIGQVTDGMSGADLANLVNLTLEDKTMAELQGRVWIPTTAAEMIQTAKRLGLLKEERRRIGFIQPGPNGG
ncbi:MAG: ATP-binding protein [Smithella sp.]|nr:ATP-binding protein [Smithella sp.]